MRTLQDIQYTLGAHKVRLFHDYSLKSMAIFGSYLRRENKDASDLDILVEFSDKIGIRFIDLAEELESIVGFKVDLVSKKALKPHIGERILEEVIMI